MNALDRLASTVEVRKGADSGNSWTAELLESGPEKCAEKFGEEAVEAIIAAVRSNRENLRAEKRRTFFTACWRCLPRATSPSRTSWRNSIDAKESPA